MDILRYNRRQYHLNPWQRLETNQYSAYVLMREFTYNGLRYGYFGWFLSNPQLLSLSFNGAIFRIWDFHEQMYGTRFKFFAPHQVEEAKQYTDRFLERVNKLSALA